MLVPNKTASSPRLKTLPMKFTPQRFHRMTTRVWVPGVYKVGAIGMTPPNGLANICTWYMSGIYCQLGDNMLLRTFLTRTSKKTLTKQQWSTVGECFSWECGIHRWGGSVSKLIHCDDTSSKESAVSDGFSTI